MTRMDGFDPLAPQYAEHLGDGGELLAGAAFAGAGGLGGLDTLPVSEGHGVDAAGLEQEVEPAPAGAATVAPGRRGGGDAVGDLEAVGAVGADRAGRPAPRPADAPQPL